jgi:hypothetical protein
LPLHPAIADSGFAALDAVASCPAAADDLPAPAVMCSGLLQRFAAVSDGRRDQGRVHPVAVVLTLCAAPVLGWHALVHRDRRLGRRCPHRVTGPDLRPVRPGTIEIHATCALHPVTAQPTRHTTRPRARRSLRSARAKSENTRPPTLYGMEELGPGDRERLKMLGIAIGEGCLINFVETGLIEIGNRDTEEILVDFTRILARVYENSNPESRTITVDNRDFLLGQASSAASKDEPELAVILYATWIEHFVNGLLLVALGRQGVSPGSRRALIRELRLLTKVTALWELADLPALPAKYLNLIDKITSLRNTFVHYKWPHASWQDDEHQYREFSETVDRMDSLIQMLREVEDQTLWSGRRDEIIEAFRHSGV